ncbi:MAG: peptide deformylase [Deltaproteobacteria bacterium]|jgi:peptide deformylase|nr:peptide deformylase [Deltaproteobacteria bacterium]
MILDIIQYPDPRLTQRAVELTELTDEIRTLVSDMAETMYAARGGGLAAPQVGRAVRLIMVDASGPDERNDLRVFINPRLTVLDPTPVEDEEGCLSVPFNYRAPVSRVTGVAVDALDMDWNPVHVEAEGLLAVCLQHELDHLEGTVFLDHVSRLKRMLFDTRIKKWLRRNSP